MTQVVKVSIIMPSLNVGGYIEEALNSVMAQTLREIEIICIDAGSTDGTWEIIQNAAKDDSRITALISPVKSYGFQVNMALDMAGGEYIAILETDDYVAADMYEKLYQAAREQDLDYVKCDYSTYRTEGSGRMFVDRMITADRLYYEEVFVPSEHPQTVVDDWYLWNGIYKKDFLTANKIRLSETPGAAFQDVGFLHKVASCARRVSYLSSSLYRYCVDREGASSNSNRTLSYIRREYGLLLDGIGDRPCAAERTLLYRRMARSFVRACMDSGDEILQDKEASDICKWFHRRLSEAENWGYLVEEDLPVSLREGYRHLMSPAEGFMAYRNARLDKLLHFLGEGSPIIIFGCGSYGREALSFLKKRGFCVQGFMDNNKDMWGRKIEGVEILPPDTVLSLPPTTRYLIANEKHAESIRQQLQNYRDGIMTFFYIPE